eukprot:519509-Amphidinium_carterae.2
MQQKGLYQRFCLLSRPNFCRVLNGTGTRMHAVQAKLLAASRALKHNRHREGPAMHSLHKQWVSNTRACTKPQASEYFSMEASCLKGPAMHFSSRCTLKPMEHSVDTTP